MMRKMGCLKIKIFRACSVGDTKLWAKLKWFLLTLAKLNIFFKETAGDAHS